jgi:hypothetical protein
MVPALQEVLALLDLQPGESYRTTVNGRIIEVRALRVAPAEELSEGLSEFADEEMLNLWLSVPPSPAAKTITVRRGEPLLPSPVHLDDSDLAPE